MRGLPLRAALLQDRERLSEDLGTVPHHVDDHEKHLFFLVGNLMVVEGWQSQLTVRLEHILVGGERVDRVEVVVERVFVRLHARGAAAAHLNFVFAFITN